MASHCVDLSHLLQADPLDCSMQALEPQDAFAKQLKRKWDSLALKGLQVSQPDPEKSSVQMLKFPGIDPLFTQQTLAPSMH